MGDWFPTAQAQYGAQLPPYLDLEDACEKTLILSWGHVDERCEVHDQPWPCQSGDVEDDRDHDDRNDEDDDA